MKHLTLNPTIILFFCHFIIAPVKGDWIYLMGWVTQEKYKGKYKDNCNDKYTKGTTLKSNLWDLWPLRHLLRLMRKDDHDQKNTKSKTNTKKKSMTMEMKNTLRGHLQRGILIIFKTFREHHQRAIPEPRTPKHYNHSDLTIKNFTGQHSQFLRCSFFHISLMAN